MSGARAQLHRTKEEVGKQSIQMRGRLLPSLLPAVLTFPLARSKHNMAMFGSGPPGQNFKQSELKEFSCLTHVKQEWGNPQSDRFPCRSVCCRSSRWTLKSCRVSATSCWSDLETAAFCLDLHLKYPKHRFTAAFSLSDTAFIRLRHNPETICESSDNESFILLNQPPITKTKMYNVFPLTLIMQN